MSFLTDLLGKIPAARRAQLARPPFNVLKDLLAGRSQGPHRILSPLAQPQPRLGPQPMTGPQTVSEPRRVPPPQAPPPPQMTTPEQLGKFWGGAVKRQGGFPMQEHIPALIETEKEFDLPGFAKVAALISQLESSGGHNIPQGTFNPYGLTYAKEGGRAPLSYESIPGATEALAEEFTKPGGYYQIPRGTELTLPYVKEHIAPRYNVEGGGYWPTFAEWWEALE